MDYITSKEASKNGVLPFGRWVITVLEDESPALSRWPAFG